MLGLARGACSRGGVLLGVEVGVILLQVGRLVVILRSPGWAIWLSLSLSGVRMWVRMWLSVVLLQVRLIGHALGCRCGVGGVGGARCGVGRVGGCSSGIVVVGR